MFIWMLLTMWSILSFYDSTIRSYLFLVVYRNLKNGRSKESIFLIYCQKSIDLLVINSNIIMFLLRINPCGWLSLHYTKFLLYLIIHLSFMLPTHYSRTIPLFSVFFSSVCMNSWLESNYVWWIVVLISFILILFSTDKGSFIDSTIWFAVLYLL